MNYLERKGKQFFVELYINQQLSIGDIAKLENVTSTTIRKALHSFGIPIRQQNKASPQELDQIQQLIAQNVPVAQIANMLNRSEQFVRSKVRKHDLTYLPPVTKDVLEDMYFIKKMSGVEIGEHFSVHSSTVYNWFRAYSINTSEKNVPFYELVDKDVLNSLYHVDQLSTGEIAEKYSVEVQKVVYALNHHNITIKPMGWKSSQLALDRYPNISVVRDVELMTTEKQLLTNQEIAKKYNVSEFVIQEFCAKHNIPNPAKASLPERKVEELIKSLGLEYQCGTRKIIKPLEIDIWIPSLRVGIEINGCHWHSEQQDRINPNYHKRKTLKALSEKVHLLQFWDYEITEDGLWEISKRKIIHACNKSVDKVYARKCIVVEQIRNSEAKLFNEANHIQGHLSCSIVYGLKFDNKLVALMGFRKIGDKEYDLARYCTSIGVVGGFNKLLEHFKRNHDWQTIETYANMRFSNHNNIYENNGFSITQWSEPNYFYVKSKHRLSRQQCMKHKLAKMLPKFDETLSEGVNMNNNGWYRVYDCGHLKYVLTNQ